MRVPRFRCLYCDHCCFFGSKVEMPTVFPWEKRLLEEIGEERGIALSFEPLQVFRDSEGRCVVTLYRWIIDGYCPFYDNGAKRCSIHGQKPLACRVYPLLVEMPSGRLMLSGKCDWVKRQGRRLVALLEARPDLIPRVFPSEFEAARDILVEFSSMLRFIEEKGLRRVKGLEECSSGVYDVDDYIARFG